MTPPKHQRPSTTEGITAMASAWLARRDKGLTPDEESEFALWRFSDPRHAAAVARLETAWGAMDALREFRPDARVHPDAELLAAPKADVVLRFPRGTIAVAAAALLMVGLFLWLAVPFGGAPRRQAIVHPGPERMALEDGSMVELNTGARIEVAFTEQERLVRLVRGEAHFTVAKNPDRPFVVSAGIVSVRAVGTAFSVSLAQQSVTVLVTHGRVQLNAPTPTASSELPRLEAGQRAVIDTASLERPASDLVPSPTLPSSAPPPVVDVRDLTPVEVERSLSWQGIRLEFIDMRLSDVVSDFNRYNRQKLVVRDRGLDDFIIGGNFRADNVDAFVRLLETSFGISVIREGEEIVLRQSP